MMYSVETTDLTTVWILMILTSLTEIDQFNMATLAGDASADQVNDLTIGQGGSLVNTCDETDGGVNQANVRT